MGILLWVGSRYAPDIGNGHVGWTSQYVHWLDDPVTANNPPTSDRKSQYRRRDERSFRSIVPTTRLFGHMSASNTLRLDGKSSSMSQTLPTALVEDMRPTQSASLCRRRTNRYDILTNFDANSAYFPQGSVIQDPWKQLSSVAVFSRTAFFMGGCSDC